MKALIKQAEYKNFLQRHKGKLLTGLGAAAAGGAGYAAHKGGYMPYQEESGTSNEKASQENVNRNTSEGDTNEKGEGESSSSSNTSSGETTNTRSLSDEAQQRRRDLTSKHVSIMTDEMGGMEEARDPQKGGGHRVTQEELKRRMQS